MLISSEINFDKIIHAFQTRGIKLKKNITEINISFIDDYIN